MEDKQKIEILYNKYPNYDWTVDFSEIPDLDDCSYYIDMVYGDKYPKINKNNNPEINLLEFIVIIVAYFQ